MPTLFYGVFLEITETSVLVSCLLCFGCSCWSVFGGAGIWKNLGNLGLYTLTLLKTKYLFLLSSSHTKKSVRHCFISTQGIKSCIVLQIILNIPKKCI